jgi:hypothetical protein
MISELPDRYFNGVVEANLFINYEICLFHALAFARYHGNWQLPSFSSLSWLAFQSRWPSIPIALLREASARGGISAVAVVLELRNSQNQ